MRNPRTKWRLIAGKIINGNFVNSYVKLPLDYVHSRRTHKPIVGDDDYPIIFYPIYC